MAVAQAAAIFHVFQTAGTHPGRKIMTGGCACGKVPCEAEGEPGRVGICHCLDCRKYHGAPFHASAIYRDHQVTITREAQLYDGRYFSDLRLAGKSEARVSSRSR